MSALGTFAAGTAHELLNPLTGCINFIDYCLRHTDSKDKRYTLLTQAQAAIWRCVEIVKNLLSFAHFETGNELPNHENILNLVNSVIELLRVRIEKENIQLSIDIGQELPLVYVARNRMQQVIMNVLTNALDAVNKQNYPSIRITAQQTGQYLKLIFQDNGCGIPIALQGKVFDPFFTTKPAGYGTGLGLPLVKSFVEEQGGQIILRSREGEGTILEVMLPII
jgi:signal transduction histidine kinase